MKVHKPVGYVLDLFLENIINLARTSIQEKLSPVIVCSMPSFVSAGTVKHFRSCTTPLSLTDAPTYGKTFLGTWQYLGGPGGARRTLLG